VGVLLIASAWFILTLSLTTRQGVNGRVTVYSIPAYVKAIDFAQRHFQYQLLVSRICSGTLSEDCVLALFDWTHANIRPTPDGWTETDDHVTNIIIRGYGGDDQIADVFVTLAGYAGVPAVFKWILSPGGDARLVLALAQLNGRWVPFDVTRHIAFRDRNGQLASIDDLLADRTLIGAQASGILIKDVPYPSLLTEQTLLPFTVEYPLRAEMQQPWPRLQYELQRLIGLEGD
jgi:hypothetical protein